MGIGVGDTSLKAYNLVETAIGEPRLTSFLVNPAQVPGWKWSYENSSRTASPSSASTRCGTATSTSR